MNIGNVILSHHSTTDQHLRERLWPLKLDCGDFRYVLSDINIYRTLQVILAQGFRGGLYGWAGIYYRVEDFTTIGIFVREQYRHCGIGGLLKQRAIETCKSQGKICYWQDTKNGNVWYKVDPEGNESVYRQY